MVPLKKHVNMKESVNCIVRYIAYKCLGVHVVNIQVKLFCKQ